MDKDKKLYGREDAIAALYELKRQGFSTPEVALRDDGTLLLSCSGNLNGMSDSPEIDVDCVDSWYLSPGEENAPGFKTFWWVFD